MNMLTGNRTTQQVLREAKITTRPLDELELRSILRTLLTMTRSGVLVTDLEHRPLACNDAFGQIFHVDFERVPQMEIEELRSYVYPRLRDPEAWRTQLDAIYAQPELTFEDELELVSDQLVVINRRTSPLTNAEGQIIGRVWTFDDITREIRRRIRREAIQAISVFHHVDPAVVCREVTQRVGSVFGSLALLSIFDNGKLLFREASNVPEPMAHVQGNELDDSYCQFALRDHQPVSIQDARQDAVLAAILPCRLGFTRYLGVPLFDVAGAPVGTLCFMDNRSDEMIDDEDVEFMSVMANRVSTELERERHYQARTEAQRRELMRQAQELTWTHEVLTAMNRSFELLSKPVAEDRLLAAQAPLIDHLLGAHKVSLLVQSEVNLNPGDILVLDKRILARVPIEHRTLFLSLEYRHDPPMSEEFLRTHVSALVDQIALLFESHRLQEDLRRTHAELRQAQNRLIQAEKLSVVGTLAASVAHDIRNIMASISLECAAEGDPAETLRGVRVQVDRFAVLSHRLLSYVRPKFLARETVDLNEIAHRAAGLLGSQIRIAGVELALDLAPELPKVPADAHRAEHLLVNLMLNALQAMRHSGGELRLSTATVEDGIQIRVADNGRGIPADVLDRVFEPFYSSRPDGFGLGLYSCRQIAQEHGWQMNVESVVGVGTTFCIQIPPAAPPPEVNL